MGEGPSAVLISSMSDRSHRSLRERLVDTGVCGDACWVCPGSGEECECIDEDTEGRYWGARYGNLAQRLPFFR